jgi:multidrug resistance efflux pump
VRIAGPFAVLPGANTDVRAAIEGIVERVHVNEGARLAAGAKVARLSDKDQLIELRKIEAGIKEAQAKLQMQELGPTTQEIEVARAAVAKTSAQATFLERQLASTRPLFKQGFLPRKEFEDTQAQAAAAKNELAEATGRLSALLSRVRPEEIAATKAQLEGLHAQKAYIEEQVRLVDVLSPADGIVATPDRQLKALVGQLVKKGDLIAKVYDLKRVTAHISISEREIAGVHVGQKVSLRARAYPGEAYSGTVVAIATSTAGDTGASVDSEGHAGMVSTGGVGGGNGTILVTTEIANPSLALKPGMTGYAKVHAGDRRLLALIARRLALTLNVDIWSWW